MVHPCMYEPLSFDYWSDWDGPERSANPDAAPLAAREVISFAFNSTEPTATQSNSTFASTSAADADDSARITQSHAEQPSTANGEHVPAQPVTSITQTIPSPAASPHPYLSWNLLTSLLVVDITAEIWDMMMCDAETSVRDTIAGKPSRTKASVPSTPAESTSTRGQKDPPRPRNCFILFRQSVLESEKLPPEANSDQRYLSFVLGRIWHILPDACQDLFKQGADVLKAIHKKQYPEYVYQPERKTGAKRSKRKRRDVDEDEGDEAKENKCPRGKRTISSKARSSRPLRKGKGKIPSIDAKSNVTSIPPPQCASPTTVLSSSGPLSSSSASLPTPSSPSSLPPPPSPKITSVTLLPPPTTVPSSLPPTPVIARPPSVVPPTLPSLRAHLWNPIPWLPDFGNGEADWSLGCPMNSTWDHPVPVAEMLRPPPNQPIVSSSSSVGPYYASAPELSAPDLFEPSMTTVNDCAPIPEFLFDASVPMYPPAQSCDELLLCDPLFDGPTDCGDHPHLPFLEFPF